jgi:hypothetical protein
MSWNFDCFFTATPMGEKQKYETIYLAWWCLLSLIRPPSLEKVELGFTTEQEKMFTGFDKYDSESKLQMANDRWRKVPIPVTAAHICTVIKTVALKRYGWIEET